MKCSVFEAVRKPAETSRAKANMTVDDSTDSENFGPEPPYF
jgi:hypothetical protein